jgi:O-acetyl-ADP-ribose deacetylase (regulator of RNase III)
MKFNEIEGDLIKLAKEGKFDVIAHGCNCFCVMGAGLAPQMAKAFGADTFYLEGDEYKGDINKLGQIEFEKVYIKDGVVDYIEHEDHKPLAVVNCYSQYDITGRRSGQIDLDYGALGLCFKKMNHIFAGKHIGLPEIGCHLAGGDWKIVEEMIRAAFTKCDVTIVHYKP